MQVLSRRLRFLAILVVAGALVAACGDGSSSPSASNSSPSGGTSGTGGGGGTSGGTNTAPTISGKPQGQVLQGQQYVFAPSASDANGDKLTFSVTNLPSWATFDAATGRISGMPSSGDIGTYQSITIKVSDGQSSVALASFSIEVVATATGSVTLGWQAPTQKTDGSPLTNLAGFKIYWGTTPGDYTNSVTLSNPGVTTYVVDQLTPATWYFVATALDGGGVESNFSNAASVVVN